MTITEHAKNELDILLNSIEDEEDKKLQERMNDCVLQFIELMSSQGHSGLSAHYMLSHFDRLARFKPLTPLTGADEEWTFVSQSEAIITQQNKRCPSVFRTVDYQGNFIEAHDTNDCVYSEDGGETWFTTNRFGHYKIEFPYSPPSEPEKVIVNEMPEEDE